MDTVDEKSGLVFRPYHRSDLTGMSGLVDEAWNYGEYGYGKRVREAQSKRELLDSLAKSNYRELAFVDGRLAGFLLGDIKGSPPEDDRHELLRRAKKILFEAMFKPEGKLLRGYATLYARSNERLLRESGKNYSAEVVFFVVGKDFKGLGLGGMLLERFERAVASNGGESIYLFSDSTCDHTFYEHVGYEKNGCTLGRSELRNNEVLEFYLYERGLKTEPPTEDNR